MMSLSSIKIVVIENLQENIEDPFTATIFSKLVAMKREGYRSCHPGSVMPYGSTDFFGTHFIICKQDGREFTPLAAYKSVTKSQCEFYGMNFPPFDIFKASGAEQHLQAMKELYKNHDGREPRYCSSYTMLPELERSTRALMKDLIAAIQCNYLLARPNDLAIAGGNVELHVDQMFHSWGYEYFSLGGAKLDSFKAATLNDKETHFLSLNQLSTFLLDKGRFYRSLWENRIEVSPARPAKKIAA